MQVQATSLPEVKLISPRIFRDDRGFFLESYSRRSFAAALQIDPEFVQDNHSRSERAGVVRGLHFQIQPNVQGKLVRVVAGAIFDAAVDIRVGSPTYGRHMSVILNAQDHRQVWIPAGFAHGFCTLTPGTEVVYKVTAPYDPACDRGIAWDDPALQIPWPVAADTATLSPKDRQHPRLADLPTYFTYAADPNAVEQLPKESTGAHQSP